MHRIIFNTSFIINEEAEEAWIDFIREHYIAVLHQHKLCNDIIFTKVSIDQPDGKTYSLQIVFHSSEQEQHFMTAWLPKIEEQLIAAFGNRYLCFSSVLTEIH